MVEVRTSISLRKKVFNKLEKQSKKKNLSRSQVIENALNKYLKKRWWMFWK